MKCKYLSNLFQTGELSINKGAAHMTNGARTGGFFSLNKIMSTATTAEFTKHH